MTKASLSVVPIFSTPLAVVELPVDASANAAVAETLARNAAVNSHSKVGGGDRFCYRSGDDLLEWAEGPLRLVCDEIIRGIWSTVAAVNTFTAEQMKSLTIQTRGSFAILQSNGCLPAISYALTSWCAIYCVQAPQASTERADSGIVRLYESRLATMFADATNSAMRIPFTPGHYSWRPVPGSAAIFPGFLNHEVPLIRASGRLALIMVRARFVGRGQEGLSRW